MTIRSGGTGIRTVLRTDSVLFLELTRSLLDGGSRVRFRAAGTSMHPAIQHADQVTVAPMTGGISRGDVLLCRQRRGPTAHRVVAVRRLTAGVLMILRGDNTRGCDRPVRSSQVLGRVIETRRGGTGRRVSRLAMARYVHRSARTVRALAAWVAR